MPAYFSGTINALKKGVTKMTADAAIKKIEAWEEALQDVEITGVRAILRDLGVLKRQLDQDEPDGDRIRTILSRLADATIKISEKVEDRNGEKVRNLGDALEAASEEEEGEDETNQNGSRGYRDRDDHRLRGNESERLYESRRRSDDGRGRVTDPEHDHRLRGNESERLYESRRRSDDGRGRVTDPEDDHRLRGNESERLYESRHRSDDGRGRVTDPEDDHRLRGNESERLYESRHRSDDGRGRVTDPERDHRLRDYERDSDHHESHDGRGRVRDPKNDGRLRQNRERGVSMTGTGGTSRYNDDQDNEGYRTPSARNRSRYEDEEHESRGRRSR